MSKRRKFTSAFRTTVVLGTLSERYTSQELGLKYEIHPNQIAGWKREFLAKAEIIFENGGSAPKAESEEEKLFNIFGQQRVEIDFLRKALS